MSEWIRNRKRTNGCPDKLFGKHVDIRSRDGAIEENISAEKYDTCWNQSDGDIGDILAYRIIEDEPDVAEKNPAKIAPKLWAAHKDVLNDEALAALRDVICEQWGNAGWGSGDFPTTDSASIYDAFCWDNTIQGTHFWQAVYHNKYNKPTTALELQDAEIGIPEPVDEIVYSTEQPELKVSYVSIGYLNPDQDSIEEIEADIKSNHMKLVSSGKSKYHKPCKGVVIDVYDVLVAFSVTCPAMAHAIKKMLMAGLRGAKDSAQDKEEAIASIKRSIELESEK